MEQQNAKDCVRRGKKLEYYAKSPESHLMSDKEGQIVEKTHKTLKEHLEDTVKCAEDFFHLYGKYFSEKEKKLIIDACRLHDIGKANDIFQTKVNPLLEKIDKEQIPHGFLSAVILSKKIFLEKNPQCNFQDFCVLLTAIYYHHSRLDICDAEELKDYCKQFYLHCIKEYLSKSELSQNLSDYYINLKGNSKDEDIAVYTSNRNNLLFLNRKEQEYIRPKEQIWCEYMLIKGMLNKFDWAVSAGYEQSEITADITEKKLCQHIEEALLGKFRPAQVFMMENKDKSVVMIAPTGAGKTEAALMWLDGEKGFYTLPLKVSSNAIYKRIRENYKFENVALLHSDSINNYLKEADGDLEKGYQNYERAKLLSYPLTVCTVDQLFRFVYKALGTEIFAATLKYSKVIIDEIQSYSPRIVAALIYGLREVKYMGGRFAIITATFPPVLHYFMEKNNLLEGRDYVFHDFSDSGVPARHRIRSVEGELDVAEISKAAKSKKVLIICNTILKAQNVYRQLQDEGEKPGLLHSGYIRKHRTILEKNIMDFSIDKTKTGIWITTQIVEASLDIDFDILYTEMCTADSLLQRMGRCNRAGKKETEIPNVIVQYNSSGRGTVYDKELYDRSARLLKKYEGKLFSESDKKAYIDAVYDVQQIRETEYFRQIEKNIEHFSVLRPAEYDAAEAQENFRAIQNITVIPDIIYYQNSEAIQSIKDLLKTPHIDKSMRNLLKAQIVDMTLSLNNKHYIADVVDRDTIGVFDIHRTRLKYDFDGNSGLGLLMNEIEDEDYFV